MTEWSRQNDHCQDAHHASHSYVGAASVKGLDVVAGADEFRKRIGFILGGERGLYWRLFGIDNLPYFARLYGIESDVTKKRIPYLPHIGRASARSGC